MSLTQLLWNALIALLATVGWLAAELSHIRTQLQETQVSLSNLSSELDTGKLLLWESRHLIHEQLTKTKPHSHTSLASFKEPSSNSNQIAQLIPSGIRKWHGKKMLTWTLNSSPEIPSLFSQMSYHSPNSHPFRHQGQLLVKDIATLRDLYENQLQQKNQLDIFEQFIPNLLPAHGRLSDRFGIRAKHPITGKRCRHKGIDIAAPKGSPIFAAAAGKVVSATYHHSYGKTILIDHQNGLRTRYAHANEMFVKKGDKVHKASKIATIGETGRAKGCHLHFELLSGNEAIDPLPFMRDLPPDDPASKPSELLAQAS